MTMGIDTRIDGTPEDVGFVADWVATSVSPRIQDCAEKLYGSRNTADAGWDGPASDVFVDRATTTASEVDSFARVVEGCASALREAADALAEARSAMESARQDAADAGLLVMKDAIAEPILDEHRPAYRAAETAVAGARELERIYAERLRNIADGLMSHWFFVATNMIAGGGAAAARAYASSLLAKADDLSSRGTALMEAALHAGPQTPARLVYRDWDLGNVMVRSGEELVDAAEDLTKRTHLVPARLGGALAAAEIGYDIYSGTPVGQAVASGAAGLGASVATGALIGTFAGGPVGTVVGAGAGAVAGIYASGVVDGYFEDGFDGWTDTATDGVDAIVDTGVAVADLAVGAWREVF
ncbi:hypothetical protein QMK17_17380 [Rhodococcus sp. G-MC3]|uniref:hypothetical protein n=1 Tax=Rhodococcus sp. G-MC3 TaxID=3046209 RepID=UPI0024B95021|nr:hypothetical protein [Rhodococcus sp. G-MC3]MDJ0395099.1 hypothetical protein [Rhodococcus sp. G-MC3]